MADLILCGQDQASDSLYVITLEPYAVINDVIPDHDFRIDDVEIRVTHSNRLTTYDYNMVLSGGVTEAHRDSFARNLEGLGVPGSACHDTVGLLYSYLCQFDSLLCNKVRNISAILMIEARRIEDREAMIASVEDYSLRAMPACRAAVEALEKVSIRAGEEIILGSCAVCLEEFSIGSEATKMPCSHVFHGDCIERWLESRFSCPVCRFELPQVIG